ncbi:MAG: hypothetical protein AB7U97_02685 [Pirellulales bacterium]
MDAETADLPWVSGTAALPYAIRFQNSAGSLLPAQSVTITEQLDSDLDWQSFELTEFRFQDQIVFVPQGRSYYYERVDLRDEYGVFVDVEGGIDVNSGIVTWTIQTIDPATGIAPADKRVGIFTPASGIMGLADPGQSQVGYTVRARAGVFSGTVIDTQALVAFDTKEPVLTPPSQVQVDGIAPTSSVSALPAATSDLEFMVSWSGADDAGGMGLADYTVYVSDNGSPYVAWQVDTTAASAPFIGQLGHSYAFYSIGRDNIGNVEATPDSSDAVILVAQPDVTAPTSSVLPLAARQSLLDFEVHVTGIDFGIDASGVQSFDVFVSTDGAAFTLWQTLPADDPVAIFNGASNHTYAFHSIARDYAGNVETKASNAIEASTYLPDLTAPTTEVTSAIADAAGTFTIVFSGTADGSSGISTFRLYVQLDGGPVQQIGQINGGTVVAGVYSGQSSYQGLADGTSHTYRFYTQGVNGNGVIEDAPAEPDDVQIVATFATPAAPDITGFTVQHGLGERSYIRYLDVTFNTLVTGLALDPSHVALKHYALDGTTFIGNVDLSGKLQLVDHVMEIDFGAAGLGGNPNSTAGDGYYELAFDLDDDGDFETARYFYRLFGDVSGDRIVRVADLNAIVAAIGQMGDFLEADANGDGRVNTLDRTFAARSLGRRLASGLHLD